MLQEKEFGITYSKNTLAALYMQLMKIKLIEIGLIISHAILAYRKVFLKKCLTAMRILLT